MDSAEEMKAVNKPPKLNNNNNKNHPYQLLLIAVTNPWRKHHKGRRASFSSVSECHGREGGAMLVMAGAHGGDQEPDNADLNQKQTFKCCPERPQEALLIAGSAFQRFHILPKRVPTAGDRVFKPWS